ncbi:MAG: 50S ribosomal protein L21 [Albidovulum sp.]|nr:50S ribosomal protein L21 [Albidovulum sp.]
MYAIIRTGGKQYRVEKDDVLYIEKLTADQGETVRIDDVLMIGGNETTRIGTPLVDGAHVSLRVFEHVKDRKVINFVRRRRKSSSKRTKGHRQWLSVVKVEGIYGPDIEKNETEK